MAKQTINIGAAPNDGTGTPLRTSFDYTNQNFTELYNALGGGVGLPGATNQVIFNNGTNLAGDGGLIYSSATDALTAGSFNPTASAIPTNGIYLPSSKNIGIAVDGVNVLNIDGIASRVTTTGSATITGDLTVDTSTLKVASGSNQVGVGITTFTGTQSLQVLTGVRISDANPESLNCLNLAVTSTTSTIETRYGTPLIFGTNATECYRIAAGGTSTWSVGGSTAMTLNSTGLGIGVTPAAKLDVYQATLGTAYFRGGYSARQLTLTATSDGVNDGAVHTFLIGSSAGQYKFSNSSGTLMSLDASGNLLVGTTDTGSNSGIGIKSVYSSTAPYVATVGSSTSASSYSYLLYSTGGTPAYKFYVSYSGQISATSGTVAALSDARFKENVQDIDVGLGAILALKPRKFDWKAGKGKDIKGDRGFIAQEFEQVFPNLIEEWADPAPEGEAPYKSVRQDLIPVLVKAIQELTARVEALEA
jgi:hypothetical protein